MSATPAHKPTRVASVLLLVLLLSMFASPPAHAVGDSTCVTAPRLARDGDKVVGRYSLSCGKNVKVAGLNGYLYRVKTSKYRGVSVGKDSSKSYTNPMWRVAGFSISDKANRIWNPPGTQKFCGHITYNFSTSGEVANRTTEGCAYF